FNSIGETNRLQPTGHTRHEDFQSSYRTETMCTYRSLLVSIQAFNGGFLRPIFHILKKKVLLFLEKKKKKKRINSPQNWFPPTHQTHFFLDFQKPNSRPGVNTKP